MFEHEPNVTDKKFPGNQIGSYRSVHPFIFEGEISDWVTLSDEEKYAWHHKVISTNGDIIN